MFPAVESAIKATQYHPNWSAAWQTLGRAQLGLGEVYLVSVRPLGVTRVFMSFQNHSVLKCLTVRMLMILLAV